MGNLFNFYYGVFPHLSKGLDVPFKTDQLGTRRLSRCNKGKLIARSPVAPA